MLPPAALENLTYNVTSFDDLLGGATFPFLEQTQRAWRILTRPVDEPVTPHPAHTFGKAGETRPYPALGQWQPG